MGEVLREGWGKRQVMEEMKKQVWLAGPLIMANLLEKIVQIVSLMFVGHLGELPLSGAATAMSFSAATGFSLLLGMGSALDTFCGQAFGAKRYHMLGVHLQRAMFISTLLCIPLAIIWVFTGETLILLGQNKEISMAAGSYVRCMIPTLFAYGLLQCHYRFLQAQNIVFPMLLGSGITALFHIFICWILVFKCQIGYRGDAIANSISYCLALALMAMYVRLSPKCKQTWTGCSADALHDLISFVKLAIPSALMICLEIWSFQALVLFAGLLPNPKLETSVLSISLNSSIVVFMIPYGIGASVSTRVSNELGAGHSQTARLAVCVAGAMSIAQGVLVGCALIFGRHIWARLYSNEKQVLNCVASMMPLLAGSNFIDVIQCVLSGTCRGCGWQKFGAMINLGAYYLVGIPCAALFAFVLHLHGKGLWLGITCGMFAQASLHFIITLRLDWEKNVKNIRNGVDESINLTPLEARTDIEHVDRP